MAVEIVALILWIIGAVVCLVPAYNMSVIADYNGFVMFCFWCICITIWWVVSTVGTIMFFNVVLGIKT